MKKIPAARIRSIIEALLREWHPQWLTRAELQALSPTLARVPGQAVERQLAIMHQHELIVVELHDRTHRIYWKADT